MNSKQQPLPDFDNPPLNEVVLSVHFDSLPKFQTPQIGLLWEKYRKNFPKIEEHPPIDPVIESFDVPPKSRVQFEIMQSMPTPRCWFINSEGTELIQVQKDRFIHNWRQTDEGDTYPRYKHVRKQFKKELKIFCDFLAEEQVGELLPVQCEVTYINHIESGEVWDRHGQLELIIANWSSQYSDDFLSEPENIRVATQHIFNDQDGEPLGRLHFSVQPAFKKTDGKPIVVLTLTARGHPLAKNNDGILGFLDKGHEMIVQGFKSVTSTKMHKVWGFKG